MALAGELRLQAPAKINLCLRITGRRQDGYHTLESRMQKVDLYDQLTLSRIEAGIELICGHGDIPTNEQNLAYRAAALFFANVQQKTLIKEKMGVRIVLEKNIPVAAGLGGGSSDAAMVLLGMNRLFAPCFSETELSEMGLALGADVPFFISGAPALLASGIGEVLTLTEPLYGCHVVLVNPGFPVSTKWVYQNFTLTKKDNTGSLPSSAQRFDIQKSSSFALAAEQELFFCNDLEAVTLKHYPEIAAVKQRMRSQGADVALMSGSGPTVFGLFRDGAVAISAFHYFRAKYQRSFLVNPLQEAAWYSE